MARMSWSECISYNYVVRGVDTRWQIGSEKDLNCDGLTTISDVWAFVGWLLHAPGDSLFRAIAYDRPGFASFFEVSAPYHATHFSTGVGVILLLVLWLGFGAADH